ncbi:hypothetical protein [Halogeometricum borinquense]|nr:hypothetical protein [Halogeometricum borinquense]
MEKTISGDCNDLDGHGIIVDGIDVGKGDSGGPIYRIETIGGVNYAVLAAHTTHFIGSGEQETCTPGDERSIGSSAAGHAWYHKDSEYNLIL